MSTDNIRLRLHQLLFFYSCSSNFSSSLQCHAHSVSNGGIFISLQLVTAPVAASLYQLGQLLFQESFHYSPDLRKNPPFDNLGGDLGSSFSCFFSSRIRSTIRITLPVSGSCACCTAEMQSLCVSKIS